MPSFLAIADLLAPAIARTRLNIHLRSEDFVRIVLRGDVRAFTNGVPNFDDMTVLALRRRG
jgi:hypothetical protein